MIKENIIGSKEKDDGCMTTNEAEIIISHNGYQENMLKLKELKFQIGWLERERSRLKSHLTEAEQKLESPIALVDVLTERIHMPQKWHV